MFSVNGQEKCFVLVHNDIISLFRNIIRMTQWGISDVLSSRDPVQPKIKIRQKHRPLGLPTIKNVRGHKILKIFVVADYGNRVCSAHKPRVHIMEGVDNCEELLVMDFIINFGWAKFAGVIHDWVKVTMLVRLL